MKDFSQRIAHRMAELGLTQSDIARRLDTNQSTVSRWLRGSIPNRRILSDLCVVLACNPEWLAFGTGEIESRPPPESILADPGRTVSQDQYRQLLENLIAIGDPKAIRTYISTLADCIAGGDYQKTSTLNTLVEMIRRIRPEILGTQPVSYLSRQSNSEPETEP